MRRSSEEWAAAAFSVFAVACIAWLAWYLLTELLPVWYVLAMMTMR